MLKLKNLIENDKTAKMLLEHYDLNHAKMEFFRSSSNVIYRIKAEEGWFFLRYTTEDERTAEMIQAELDYIHYLCENGVHANEPVLTREGTELVQVDGYLAVLFQCVKGRPFEILTVTPELAGEWGRQLGRIHQLAGTYQNKPGFKRPDIAERFEEIRTILKKENQTRFLKFTDWLEPQFQKFEQTEMNYGLCHYDFEVDNVFWEDESKEFSMIDFDDCMYHYYAIDLIQVLMSIEDDLPEENTPWIKEEFIKGYEEYFQKPEEELFRLTQDFVALYGYAKLVYCLAYPPEAKPDWMEELIQKLNHMKEQKEGFLVLQEEAVQR